MIENSTYQKSWIEEKARRLGKVDRKLLEKVIMSLALVEQLRTQQMEFIFKGGTALVLLLEQPRRFSIDVDIILPEKPKTLNTVFDNIIEQSPFTKWVADNERKSSTNAPVEHYKFFYQSAADQYVQEEPILLDILYADNYYPKLKDVSIRHPWLVTEEPYMSVSIPTLESILGDKLTAFAPNTTGILYEKNRPVEIIKQLYDIGSLFDLVEQLDIVKTSFEKMAADEIRYRELNITSDDILKDIFETALTISIFLIVPMYNTNSKKLPVLFFSIYSAFDMPVFLYSSQSLPQDH